MIISIIALHLVIALHRSCSDVQWSGDLLKVSAVFLGAGLFFFVLFSAQLFLIYQIEKRFPA
jgi:hypothetical protein